MVDETEAEAKAGAGKQRKFDCLSKEGCVVATASKRTKMNTFTASMLVRVVVDIPLKATTFDDALVEAKALKAPDCVDFKTDDGSYNDGQAEVISVSNQGWTKVDE